jgi:glyoxylase-like metal-dependent hydrolase (beta-lactamase superfamily II)
VTNLTWQIGEFTVTKVVETEGVGPNGGSESALADAWPEAILEIGWLVPDFATSAGHLGMSVHALLVETPALRLIVDTCIGNDKTRAIPHFDHLTTGFLNDLEAAGWPPESVDAVVCTHLHVDHVGWNTMLVDGTWVPTFPRAMYYMARAEVEHLQRQADSDNADLSPFAGAMMDPGNVYSDSVRPIVDAGLAVMVEPATELSAGVRLMPTPGHTPGHVSVHLQSGEASAVITGDMMHHPCQIARPEWCSAFDDNPRQSVATRLGFFDRFADTDTLIIGTHFSGPTAGRLVRDNGGYRLVT